MGIYINNEQTVFHLYNHNISYIIHLLPDQGLGHLYYGPALDLSTNYTYLYQENARVLNPYSNKQLPNHSLQVTKQELPIFGRSDFREGLLALEDANGGHVYDFRYLHHTISQGKPVHDGAMPFSTCGKDEGQTLSVILKDHHSGIEVQMDYTIFNDVDVITRSMSIRNKGLTDHTLSKALSLNLDLDGGDYDMLHLAGAWSRERHVKRHPLIEGIQSIGSTKGHSSAQHNPFFALLSKDTTEHQGIAYGFNLVYSGNFLGQVEVNEFDQIRVQLGIHPTLFQWHLSPGQSFQTPEAVLMYSEAGLNGLSQVSHAFISQHILPKRFSKTLSPILANNWEATYFNFDETRLLNLATKAKDLGIDLFVLDDGWFTGRDSDRQALGDWVVDEKKFPRGMKAFTDDLRALGMKFGIWIEPEMVNELSQLNKAHPEWVIKTPGHAPSYARHQWTLDFANGQVVDYIFQSLSKVFDLIKPDYVKWDMNRYITESYSPSLDAKAQGEFYHRYTLGVYHLYDLLTKRYPETLIESCASGGGRYDLGMLCYAPQTWTSDDTDAIERLKIQYGTSIAYPIRTIGAHVSASPNHQVLREASLKTRHNVAYFGTFGYEMDLLKLTPEEETFIKSQVSYFRKHQDLIQRGTFYRLQSPFDGGQWTAWMVVSKDQSEALVGVYQVLQEPNQWQKKIQLTGLNPKANYYMDLSGQTLRGDLLMAHGIVFDKIYSGMGDDISQHVHKEEPMNTPIGYGDFTSEVFHLKALPMV